MFFTSTTKRMQKYSVDGKKFKNSRNYLKNVNKSAKALYKDTRNEITGGTWDTVSANVRSIRNEARLQKKGFYRTMFSNMLRDNNTLNIIRSYGRSVKKAVTTGNIYRSESDMFDSMLNREVGFEPEAGYSVSAEVSSSNKATLDGARATISSINDATSAQLGMGRLGIAENKAGMTRLTTIMNMSTNMQSEKLQMIYDIQNNVIRKQIDESLRLGRDRNAILTEMRDLTKKMIINNDNYQLANIEKDKTFLDLVMEGRFKDAMGKSVQDMIQRSTTATRAVTAKQGIMSMMMMALNNPGFFLKDIIMNSETVKGIVGENFSVRGELGKTANRMAGSKNGALRYIGNSFTNGENASVRTSDVRTFLNKGDKHWNGVGEHALVHVIPGLLSKILSAVEGGTPELVYDYTGRNTKSKTPGFVTTGDLRNKLNEYQNADAAMNSAIRVGNTLSRHFMSKHANVSTAPDFMIMWRGFANDLANGSDTGFHMDIESILEYSYDVYVMKFPHTVFVRHAGDVSPGGNLAEENRNLRESWDLMRIEALSLLRSSPEFRQEVRELEKGILEHRQTYADTMAAIRQDLHLSGMDALYDGRDRFKSRGGAFVTGKRRGRGAQENRWSENLEYGTGAGKKAARKTIDVNDARSIVAEIYNGDVDKANIFMSRISTMDYEDFKLNGIVLKADKFKKWLTKLKELNLTPEQREALTTLFEKGKWQEIREKVGAGKFDAYLMQIRDENIYDVTKATSSEMRKADIYAEKSKRHKRFNNFYQGMIDSFDKIGDDPEKKSQMATILGKLASIGGLTGVLAAKGLIPFMAPMGASGILMTALAGVSLGILSNKDKIKDLIFGGMTDEQKADTKYATKHVFSKFASAFGFAGLGTTIGVAGAAMGMPAFMIPLFTAASGIAGGMLSEKSPFKKFFFGQDANTERTFFDLFKEKMFGNNEEGTDGLIGRFVNPIIHKTKGVFAKFTDVIQNKVLNPLSNSFTKLVDKIDGSAIGQKFEDLMGFTFSQFGSVMKKNVWEPLTSKLFGGLKRLLGFGKKKAEELNEQSIAPYEQSDVINNLVAQTRGNATMTPTGEAGAGSSKRGKRTYGNASSRTLSFIRNNAGGATSMTSEDIMTSVHAPVKAMMGLIGSGKSDEAKHYVSQKDPKYSDMKITGYDTDENASGASGKLKNVARKMANKVVKTTIEKEGCGVIAASMILSRLGRVRNEDRGKTLTPEWIKSNVIPHAQGMGVTFPIMGTIGVEFFPRIAKRFGLEYEVRGADRGYSLKEIDRLTSGGRGALICLVEYEQLSNHYIVITGVNGDRVFYDDPARRRNMNMTYDELFSGTLKWFGFSKSKGLFGLLGRMFKRITSFLRGDKARESQRKIWGINEELASQMTGQERTQFKNKKLTKELLDKLKERSLEKKNKFVAEDGSIVKTFEDLDLASKAIAAKRGNTKATLNEAGAGTSLRDKARAAMGKRYSTISRSLYKAGNKIPNYLSRKLDVGDEASYRSMMLSATIHNTYVTGSMLQAIYTKLEELDTSMYNGTNGLAYNAEYIRRMIAIKQFGGISEAQSAIGDINLNSLSNMRSRGRSRGIIGKFKQKVRDFKDLMTNKFVDPVVMQYYMAVIGWRQLKENLSETISKLDPRPYITRFMNWTGEKFQGAISWVGRRIEDAGGIVKAGFNAVGKTMGGIGSAIKGTLVGFGNAIGGIAESMGSIVEGVMEGIFSIPKTITTAIGDLGSMMYKGFSGVINLTASTAGLGYNAAKNVISDLWGAGGAILRGIGHRIINVRDFFKGKADTWREKMNKIQYVQVLGGHIDTVGSVGAVDRDAYVRDYKRNKHDYRSMIQGKRRGILTGTRTVRNDKLNNDIDAEQDKASIVQDKQTSLLERIASKGGALIGGIGGKGEKDEKWKKDDSSSIGWGQIAAILTAIYKMLDPDSRERTKDGNPTAKHWDYTDPRQVWEAMNSEDTAWDYRHYKTLAKNIINGRYFKGIGKMTGLNKVIKGVKGVGSSIVDAGRSLRNGYNGISSAVSSGKQAFTNSKLMIQTGLSLDELTTLRADKTLVKDNALWTLADDGTMRKLTEAVGDGAANSVTYMDDITRGLARTGRVAAEETTEAVIKKSLRSKVKDVAKKGAEKAAGKFAEYATRAGKYLTAAFTKLIDSKVVRSLFGETVTQAIKEGFPKFINELFSNPAVKNAFKKTGSSLVKWLPLIDIVFFIADIYEGWNNADRYFDIPESKLTTRQKAVGAISKFLQGLIAMNLWLIWVAVLPTEWFVNAIYAMIPAAAEKAELKKIKEEYMARYDAYKRTQDASGKKALEYDDWIQDIEGKSSEDASLWKQTKKAFTSGTPQNLAMVSSVKKMADQQNAIEKATPITMTLANGKSIQIPTNTYGSYNNPFAGAYGAGVALANTGSGYGTPNPQIVNTDGAGKGGNSGNTRGINSSEYKDFLAHAKGFKSPVVNGMVSSHAMTWRAQTKSVHKGTDFAVSTGTKVFAVAGGTAYVHHQSGKGYGKYILIDHGGGWVTKYAHLSKHMVNDKQTVVAGQLIGLSGTSGTDAEHLHFEIRKGKAQDSPVGNIEKIMSFKVSPKASAPGTGGNGAAFGIGKAFQGVKQATKTGIDGIKSMFTQMYSQNSKFSMSAGGDGMTLQQVGCGPVTTNLFLQDSGVREPLMTTAKKLRSRRKKNAGFSAETLSTYITSRGVSNKVVKPDKNTIAKAAFGIVFAIRNCTINSLPENHALYMKHIGDSGVILYDPYKETEKFYTWATMLPCVFEVIIPTNKNAITASGPLSHALNGKQKTDTTGNMMNATHAFIQEALREKARYESSQKVTFNEKSNKNDTHHNNPVIAQQMIQQSKHNNISLSVLQSIDSKMSSLVELMTQFVQISVSNKPVSEEKVNRGLNNLMQSLMDSMKNNSNKPETRNGQSPWLISRNHIVKGGL